MDEISPLISLPFKLGNSLIDELVFTTCVDIELISMTKLPLVPLEHRNSSSSVPHNGVIIKIGSNCDNKSTDDDVNESCLIFGDATINKEDDSTALACRPLSRIIDFPPLWGLTSICGRRAEMEDTVVALPRFFKIPCEMLSESPLFTSISQESTAHVFAVYDGHGGSQVANYCQERLHVALAEEIGISKDDSKRIENGECNLKEQWLRVFTKCFHRMDDEVGGFPRVNEDLDLDPPLQPIAPDSVGSTAVVAIICSTHIIVANCGDSRAVLFRGKVPVSMSVDHKPNREDECTRIEGLGGKVINWDGYRVSGVLAVSRSIGDRYLRPYVVADPEIMLVSRTKEDECLILASDGLWDVMTNEEACDNARKRILIWHKKNGTTLSKERGKDIDMAAQYAAEYLSHLAFQRGSRDNISVIVIDLKAQRKFKKKNLS